MKTSKVSILIVFHSKRAILNYLSNYTQAGGEMQTFILATKLSPEGMKDLDHVKQNGKKWKEEVEKRCPEVTFKGHFFVFGQYDFISIYEAPDVETAAKVSLISQSMGAQKAESWTAIPYGEFLGIIDSVK